VVEEDVFSGGGVGERTKASWWGFRAFQTRAIERREAAFNESDIC
jgi:hypothetical protein